MSNKLAALKAEATDLNIEFHPSIGVDALLAKIDEHKAKPELVAAYVKESPEEEIERLRREANQLIRVRITCMNPHKAEHDGEIFTVSNSVVGTLKRFIPFNAEEGWHVPRIMLNVIEERKFQQLKEKKGGSKGAAGNPNGTLVREFAVEYLPEITEEEYKEIGRRQLVSEAT